MREDEKLAAKDAKHGEKMIDIQNHNRIIVPARRNGSAPKSRLI